MRIEIYIEGGGQKNKVLKIKLRQGFSTFFKKAGIQAKPISCGGREQAYDTFCRKIEDPPKDVLPILLVDSESAVSDKHFKKPWDHLKLRDGWTKPKKSDDDQAHLMVECMEAWFMADKDALKDFFGKGFDANSLPKHTDVEGIPKATLYSLLGKAVKKTKKKTYKKSHSFDILERIDPYKITEASLWAEHLINTLKKKA